MGNTAKVPVIGEKMRTGKTIARAKMPRDLKVDIDIDSMALQLVDKVIPAVQLSGVQMLRIIGEVCGVPDPPRGCIVIHMVKADHIHTELGQAGGDFFRTVLRWKIG